MSWHRWVALGERDYDLTVQSRCFCGPQPSFVTKVRDGQVVSVARSGRPRDEIVHRGWTVERLYRLLRASYREADSVRASYTDHGVPTRISIDYDTNMVDEEMYYHVRFERR